MCYLVSSQPMTFLSFLYLFSCFYSIIFLNNIERS
uniref:Uncharacterized protein n=1 Tax=Caudovirales sp. ctCiv1 TaxID=2826769 RepID=A0A8S5M8E6_9CAUD|nr:MAG TPA: hypothetical protein [Caudovirales sp. ctCiv1]